MPPRPRSARVGSSRRPSFAKPSFTPQSRPVFSNVVFSHSPGRSTRKPWYTFDNIDPGFAANPNDANIDPGFSAIPDDTITSNRRTLDGMLKFSNNGDVPTFFADAMNDPANAGKAELEIGDFLKQLHGRHPERAQAFEREVVDKLTPEARGRMTAFTRRFQGEEDGSPTPSSAPAVPIGRKFGRKPVPVQPSLLDAPGEPISPRGPTYRPTPDTAGTDEPASTPFNRIHDRKRNATPLKNTATSSRPTPGKLKNSLRDRRFLETVYASDSEGKQELLDEVHSLWASDKPAYNQLPEDVIVFHQNHVFQEQTLASTDSANPSSKEMKERIAFENAREKVADTKVTDVYLRELFDGAAKTLEGIDSLSEADPKLQGLADMIRNAAPNNAPQALHNTKAFKSAKAMAGATKGIAGLMTGPAGTAIEGLAAAKDAETRILEQGGTPEDARKTAQATVILHTALSTGGSALGKKALTALLPKMAKNRILEFAVDSLGGYVGEKAAEGLSQAYEKSLMRSHRSDRSGGPTY